MANTHFTNEVQVPNTPLQRYKQVPHDDGTWHHPRHGTGIYGKMVDYVIVPHTMLTDQCILSCQVDPTLTPQTTTLGTDHRAVVATLRYKTGPKEKQGENNRPNRLPKKDFSTLQDPDIRKNLISTIWEHFDTNLGNTYTTRIETLLA